MGSSSNKTTTTQSTEPPGWAEEGLEYGGEQALKLAKSGDLAKPLTMSTVVPYSQQTTQGMGSIQGLANSAMAPGGYNSQWGSILGSGGYNEPQMTAMEGIRNTATGEFDINANPAFQQILSRAQGDASNAVNQMASGLGRTSSGTHQGVMAREIGDLTARMTGDEYRNWQQRQATAQRDLFNIGQQGQSNLATAFERQQDPAQALMGVGSMYEDLYGRQLNDQLRIADETTNQQRNNLRELMGLLGGAGQFSTTKQVAQGPSNTASNIAGGLLGLGGLLSL